jgi:hypothetical protein
MTILEFVSGSPWFCFFALVLVVNAMEIGWTNFCIMLAARKAGAVMTAAKTKNGTQPK